MTTKNCLASMEFMEQNNTSSKVLASSSKKNRFCDRHSNTFKRIQVKKVCEKKWSGAKITILYTCFTVVFFFDFLKKNLNCTLISSLYTMQDKYDLKI